jgi:hypothetical protein
MSKKQAKQVQDQYKSERFRKNWGIMYVGLRYHDGVLFFIEKHVLMKKKKHVLNKKSVNSQQNTGPKSAKIRKIQ